MKKCKWLFLDFIILSTILLLSILYIVFGQISWKWTSILLITTYVLNSIFVIFSIANNDNQTEKLSWIFFMIVIPYIGLIFYMIFRLRRIVGKSIEEFEKEFNEFLINEYDDKLKFESNYIEWQSKLVKKNFYNSNIEVFDHGFDAYEYLLKDISEAKKYIHIEMYIIKISEIYEKLKFLLLKKVEEGVEVKIIIDKFGSWKVPIDEFKYLKNKGIKLCFFNRPFYPYVRHTDNKRLHRKFFVIDGKKVHFGGLNISDEYCSYSTKYGYWADLNFAISGKIVNDYESVFLYDWFKITKQKLDKQKYIANYDNKNSDYNAKILVFEEGPTRKSSYLEDSLDFWINNSKKSIRISTPYFVPSEKILNSLKNALRRNVKIDIFIPGLPDKKLTYKATIFFTNELSKLGANVYIFNDVFLHSKFGIFDNEVAYLGTNNFDMRSFYTNEESINILTGQKIINSLNEIFKNYEIFSNKQIVNNKKGYYLKNQFIFRLLSPLM